MSPHEQLQRQVKVSPAESAIPRERDCSSRAPSQAQCVHELVRAQAARTPGAVAVSQGSESLTYAQLDAASDALASRLATRGVGPDSVVAVLAPRSVRLIVALLGILKAGGAYLALDLDMPPARWERLLADARPVLILADPSLSGTLPPGGHTVLEMPHALETEPGEPTAAASTGPAHLAYVSYTSGSTGEPKGVCVPHAAVSRLVCAPDWAHFMPSDVFLQLAPVAFDASTLEIWAPLTTGGRLAVAPPGRVTPDALEQTLRDEGVTVAWLTAGYFHHLVDCRPQALAGLRHLLAGGDVLSRSHVERVLRTYPDLWFTNGYGPTENTTFTTCWTTRGTMPDGPVPIGRPISGTGVVLMDENRHVLTEPGESGELYAFGDGLARGYLRKPEATAERFVVLPGPDGTPQRMYRTGDLARWTPEGLLEFCGRVDQQVKIQGYRVEPEAVEAALISHHLVREAAVVARDDGFGGKRLVGYVVPDSPALTGPSGIGPTLQAAMREQLPAYMVPAVIIPLDVLPLGSTGKVDRAALSSISPADPSATRAAAPVEHDDVEGRLAQIWCELLGTPDVGSHDNFFEKGGHSLLAGRVLHLVHGAWGVQVSFGSFLEEPTVHGLARRVRERQAVAAPAVSGQGGHGAANGRADQGCSDGTDSSEGGALVGP